MLHTQTQLEVQGLECRGSLGHGNTEKQRPKLHVAVGLDVAAAAQIDMHCESCAGASCTR